MTYEANADVTTSYRYTATLDSRTTLICAELDGQIFRYDDPDKKLPPQHWNCRSTIVPVVDWDRLGLEPPPPSTRASDGGPVPATLDYEGWLRRQPAEKQDEILGPGRGKLFREGVSLSEMIRSDGSVIPLRELRGEGAAVAVQAPAIPPAFYDHRSEQARELLAQSEAWAGKLKKSERAAVTAWTDGTTYGAMPDNIDAGTLGERERAFLSALKKAPQIPDTIAVWRGEEGVDIGRYVPGMEFKHPGIRSFTVDPNVARRFGDVIFEVVNGGGSYIEGGTAAGGEYEVLFALGTKFRVLEIVEREFRAYNGDPWTAPVVRLLRL